MSYVGRLMDAHLAAQGVVKLHRVPSHPHSSDDRGWVSRRVVARVGSEKVGHITISHIPLAVFEERYANPADYCRFICGIANPTREDERRHEAQRRKFKLFHVDAVHIAYVGVEEPFQRQGIATRLYLDAARWVGEQENMVLAALEVQRPEVKALWAKLNADPDVPTIKTDDGRAALDYRPKT